MDQNLDRVVSISLQADLINFNLLKLDTNEEI